MPDFDAVTVALAARYAPAQVSAPVGYRNIRLSTADLPDKMTPLPTVLVFPDSGDFQTGNGTRLAEMDFLVRFYYNQIGDITRDMVALRKWLTVLAGQHQASVQLGGAVTVVRTMTWKIGQMSYAGTEYSGIELGVHAILSEGWAATA